MTRRSVGLAAAAASALVVLGGCSTASDHAPLETAPPDDRVVELAPGELADLVAAADLDPCPATGAVSPGSELPDLTLGCLDGSDELQLAALGGRPYVLVVWASWCAPCADEMPYLEEVYAEAGDRVGFLGINQDVDTGRALAWAEAVGMSMPSVDDADAATRPGLQVRGLPTTVLVRADGTIAGQHAGGFDSADEVRETILDLLEVEL